MQALRNWGVSQSNRMKMAGLDGRLSFRLPISLSSLRKQWLRPPVPCKGWLQKTDDSRIPSTALQRGIRLSASAHAVSSICGSATADFVADASSSPWLIISECDRFVADASSLPCLISSECDRFVRAPDLASA